MSSDINENAGDAGLVSGNVATPEVAGNQFEKQISKTIVDGFYVVSAGSRSQSVAADSEEKAISLFESVYGLEATDCVPYEGALLPGVSFLYERDKMTLVGDVVQTSQYKRWKGL